MADGGRLPSSSKRRSPTLVALLLTLACASAGAENSGLTNGNRNPLRQPSSGGWRSSMVPRRRKGSLTNERAAEERHSVQIRSNKTDGIDKGAGALAEDIDASLVSALCSMIAAGSTVLELGSGTGGYVLALRQCGIDAHGYDGARDAKEMSTGVVYHADLTVAQSFAMADWTLSLGVAEHIPARSRSIYLQNLASHAQQGVVLSWAHRGHESRGSVNHRELHEVIGMLEGLGLKNDEELSHMLQQAAESEWLKQNILVFRKEQ